MYKQIYLRKPLSFGYCVYIIYLTYLYYILFAYLLCNCFIIVKILTLTDIVRIISLTDMSENCINYKLSEYSI